MKSRSGSKRSPKVRAGFNEASGAFIIENYNWAKPLSNFLPGIAGEWGVPCWTYYVNRGQAISSLGVRDKNGQIMEFYSFNKACMRIAREGFRTFLRLDNRTCYEPFQKIRSTKVLQTLSISPEELVLFERNSEIGIEIEVVYFTLPGMPLAGLLRDVKIRNIGPRPRRIEYIDGLARILPHGLDQTRIKGIPRHIEAMMGVEDVAGVPIFRLKQTADDSEKVGRISGGHFYLSKGSGIHKTRIVDPVVLFGEEMEYGRAWLFEDGGIDLVLKGAQFRENRTPCAFSAGGKTVNAGRSLVVSSLIGYVEDERAITDLQRRWSEKKFSAIARGENARIVSEIGDRCFTASSEPVFDAYCRQDFLDNVIRGGMPIVLETKEGANAFYIYSRQNGDLERDYHFFVVEPTYLSQGTGHYRSVLQNRRMDSWYFPETRDTNLLTFMNLIQLDGYNPLEVNKATYRLADSRRAGTALRGLLRSGDERRAIIEWMAGGFSPGELLMRIERARSLNTAVYQKKGRLPCLKSLIRACVAEEQGGIHEGFWIDHWHYNLDLIDTYLMVYPDQLKSLFWRKIYSFFDDPDRIVPRDEKSVISGSKVRRYGAVVRDAEKEKIIGRRTADAYRMRTKSGSGRVYKTNLFVKLLCVAVNRIANLDPDGIGMDMEANKPAWNDSMNGLPGLFGSALGETMSLRRAIRMLCGALESTRRPSDKIVLFGELHDFISKLQPVISRALTDRSPGFAYRYWDDANTVKERYRAQTRLGIAGGEKSITAEKLTGFLENSKALIDSNMTGARRRKILSKDGVPFTYYVHDAVEFGSTGKKGASGLPAVKVDKFRSRPVKLFLEGPVHYMREKRAEAKAVYDAVRRSRIYDDKLGMYKACEPMSGESFELGRAVGAYPRGWIENESIYLHMEFKYLLEVIRGGLCKEFWRDARTTLMPFLDPAVYGRSTLEGASFVVSSAYADPRHHGQAFQPRLSGITCEFLHIWTIAVAGENPFRMNGGSLEFQLEPRLPGWLFTRKPLTRQYHDPHDGWRKVAIPKNAFGFKFLGNTLVVYHNARRADTFGTAGASAREYKITYRDGRTVVVKDAVIGKGHASAIRASKALRLDVTLE